MESQYNSIYVHLLKGEIVRCPKCKSGEVKPYNTTPDKASYFQCSNKKCDFFLHIDPMIEVE